MSQINPLDVVKRGIIRNVTDEQIQQVGVDLRLAEPVTLQPGEFVNVPVMEEFDMGDSFGLIVTRSSLSRKGVFLTSGVYDPGFNGAGGVSIYNHGKTLIELPTGFRIGQMVVFEAAAASKYNGHYNGTTSIKSQYED